MNYKRKKAFLRELGSKIWKRRNLANRCLIKSKVTNVIPNRSPVKMCTPRKVDLYLSMYSK